MKKIINKAQCLVGLVLLLTSETQANIVGSNSEELNSNNERSSVNHSEEIEIKSLSLRADDLKFYRTYVEGAYCDIEISNPNGSYEIIFRDSEGNVCGMYNSELVEGVNMDEVSNSTIPIFQQSNIDGREKVKGTIQVSDIVKLVQRKARGGERIQVHPITKVGLGKTEFESAQWFNWGNWANTDPLTGIQFGNFDNQY